MKKVLSVILSILLGIVLFSLLTFINIKNNLGFGSILNNLSNISKVSKYENQSGLFYPENKIIVAADYNPDFIISTEGLFDNLIKELKSNDIDVDEQFVKQVLNNSNVKSLLNEFFDDYLEYITGDKPDFNLNQKKTRKVIDTVIDEYENYYNVEINRDEIQNELEEAFPEIISNIEEGIKSGTDEVLNANNSGLKLYRLLTSTILSVICLLIIVILVVLIILISKSAKTTFFACGIPSTIDGCLYILIGVVILNMKGIVLNAISDIMQNDNLIIILDSITTNIGKFMRVEGIVVFVIGILLTTLGVFVKGRIDSNTEVTIA